MSDTEKKSTEQATAGLEAAEQKTPEDRAIEEAEAEREAADKKSPEDRAASGRLDPNKVLLHMPVDVRSASLIALAVLASVFALHWAKAVFIPLLISLLATYALSPLVDRLERWKISRWIGAALILFAIGGSVSWTAYSLAPSANALLDLLPVAAQKMRATARKNARTTDPSALDTVQKAAAQLEQAAEENTAKTAARRGVSRVIIERAPFNVRDYVLTGTLGLLAAAGQLTLIAFLTFFALGSGDSFRRKLVKITGPSLEKKKITVHVLDDITGHIQRYLLVQISTSALVGLATWLAFW
ncbi:MAG: AI-2E family transporter, partial [Gammaproteobacteria bacterium]|nr:AI-2E family transporter [Gammaproteobacteria bacterium]